MIETPAEILSHHADADAAKAFVAWRKTIKKPLTERAALMIAKTLSAINAEGGDATDALDLAQEHGWQTIKPNWYWNQKNGQSAYNRQPTDRPCNRPDAALENIARLAGLGQASGNGGR